jgi:amidohydrolase
VTADPSLLVEAEALLPEAVEVRRDLHAHPELGLTLPRTQQLVLDALAGLGLDSLRTTDSVSGVVATLKGGRAGGGILLRADMDALPMPEDTDVDFASTVDGAMHACCHDAHVAMLLGAARLLSERRNELAGTVTFMFQPGEEGFHGARFMLEDGLLDDGAPDAAFAIHATPSVPAGWVATKPGPVMASADVLTITITGRGGHASMPHQAADPIPAACELVLALQAAVTRTVDVFDPAVLTIAQIMAGTTNNVIPESARLVGTLRAVSEVTRRAMHDTIHRVVAGVCAAHGLVADVGIEEGYPVTVNDAAFAPSVLETAASVLGQDRTVLMPAPIMGAEDFSYVLQRLPGSMVFLGVWPQGVAQPAPNHSNRMVMDEGPMATGIALHAAVALHHLAPA